jgi:hypothetical protein
MWLQLPATPKCEIDPSLFDVFRSRRGALAFWRNIARECQGRQKLVRFTATATRLSIALLLAVALWQLAGYSRVLSDLVMDDVTVVQSQNELIVRGLADAEGCTALALNRVTGRTSAAPCQNRHSL